MSLSYSSKPVSSFIVMCRDREQWSKNAQKGGASYIVMSPLSSAEASGEGKWKARQCALSFSFFLSFFFFFFFLFLFFDYCYFLWIPSGSLCEGERDVPTIFACVADALNVLYRGLYKWFRRVRGPTKRWRYYLRAWRRVYLSGLNLPSIDQVQ